MGWGVVGWVGVLVSELSELREGLGVVGEVGECVSG